MIRYTYDPYRAEPMPAVGSEQVELQTKNMCEADLDAAKLISVVDNLSERPRAMSRLDAIEIWRAAAPALARKDWIQARWIEVDGVCALAMSTKYMCWDGAESMHGKYECRAQMPSTWGDANDAHAAVDAIMRMKADFYRILVQVEPAHRAT